MKITVTILFIFIGYLSYGQNFDFLTRGGFYKSMTVYDSAAIANLNFYLNNNSFSSDRSVNMNGKILSFQHSGIDLLNIDPTHGTVLTSEDGNVVISVQSGAGGAVQNASMGGVGSQVQTDVAAGITHIRGVVNIGDIYNLPLADGTPNQIIATDGFGQLSFVDASGSGVQTVTGDLVDNSDPLNPVVGLTGTHTLSGNATINLNTSSFRIINSTYPNGLFRIVNGTNGVVQIGDLDGAVNGTSLVINDNDQNNTFNGTLRLNNVSSGLVTDSILTRDASTGNVNYRSPESFGFGTVTSVNGTSNRITSTGGTDPIIDISSTFENLLLKKSDSTIYYTKYRSDTSRTNIYISLAGKGTGNGTVTSVAAAATGIFSWTGSPVTTSGTLTLVQTGTSGGIPYFSSTSALSSSGALTASAIVLGGGAGNSPTSFSLGTANQIVGMNNAGTANEYKTVSTSTVAVSNDVGVTLSGANALVINIPDATSAIRGIVSTGTQTFGGVKTFNVALITPGFQTSGTLDNSNLFIASGSAVSGTRSTAQLEINSNPTQTRGAIRGSTATVATAGNDVWALLIGDNTYTEAVSGTSALGGGVAITTQTMTNGAGATTAFQNFYVGNSPASTATNNYAINTGFLHMREGLDVAYVAKTANYTATASDHIINCTANTFQVTLPTAVGIPGRVYIISNPGSGTITIGTTSSQTFTNVTANPTTLTLLTLGASIQVASDGANWIKLN